MVDSRIKVGMLVALPGRRGAATVVSTDGARCDLAVFHSIADVRVETGSISGLDRVALGPETRVYVETEAGWRVGRVKAYDYATAPWVTYTVRFPNGRVAELTEDRLRVRVFEAFGDPCEVLTSGGGESQFLHDRRWGAVETGVSLKAAAQGLTGLLSASIEIVPHQVSAVRRILTDPVQRYLLADEVGMGKTIEAGAVARQCLIDDPNRNVWVLAPSALVEQWSDELSLRFGLGSPQVRIFAHGEALPMAKPDLLIVDEAHHLVEDPNRLAEFVGLAHSAPRLLLLSATPALGDARHLLSLLHILDPRAYAPTDGSKLRDRLGLSRELGRLLMSLDEGAPVFLLRRTVQQLADRLPDDAVIDTVRQISEHEDQFRDAIGGLRQHLADTYRVHHRLIRARRRDAAIYFHDRGAVDGTVRRHLRVEVDEDQRWPDILHAIEDWRDELKSDLSEVIQRQAAGRELITVLDGLSSGRRIPSEATAVRFAHTLDSDPGARPLSVVAIEVLQSAVRQLKAAGQKTPKIVAFATEQERAVEVHTLFGPHQTSALLLTRDTQPSDAKDRVTAFRESPDAEILICDRSGEEGLNLNFADGIVHLDLPFSVTRMEQRIGRLDRFGRTKGAIQQRVVLATDDDASPWAAWLDVLADGFGLFEHSTSDIQFALGRLEGDLAQAFLERGAEGLRERIPWVREQIAAARSEADEQYALDAFALADGAEAMSQSIEDAEGDEADLQARTEHWLLSALQFRQVGKTADQLRYCWTPSTLVPREPWENEFGLTSQTAMTWRRRIAMRQTVGLLRPGSQMLDAMERHLRWDDRGSAFATWRIDPSLSRSGVAWAGFRFCFVVEPALDADTEVFGSVDRFGVSRRAQGFLPPWSHRFHIDVDGAVASDAHETILARPYSKSPDAAGARDINLTSRPDLFERIAPMSLLRDRLQIVRGLAEDKLRSDPGFTSRVSLAIVQARQDQQRRERLEAGEDATLSRTLQRAVEAPRLRIDSVGFIALSGSTPESL